jgi:hypothetical protein
MSASIETDTSTRTTDLNLRIAMAERGFSEESIGPYAG